MVYDSFALKSAVFYAGVGESLARIDRCFSGSLTNQNDTKLQDLNPLSCFVRKLIVVSDSNERNC